MPDLAALPDRGHLMLLMPILPMMLIGMILLATSLDARGLLGPPRRKVSIRVPLSAIAAGLAMAAAIVHMSEFGATFADRTGTLLLLAAICFLVGWCVVHLLARSAATATAGMIGTGVIVAGWLAAHILAPTAGPSEITLTDLFGVSFEVALVLALVPQVAPSLAARIQERQMKAQRAFVLSGFCLSATALFTSLALVG